MKQQKAKQPEPTHGTIENKTDHEIVVFLGEKGRTREIIERGETSKPLPVADVRRFRASPVGIQGLDRAKETNNAEGILFVIGTPPEPEPGSYEAMAEAEKIDKVMKMTDLDEIADMRAKELSKVVCEAMDKRTQELLKAN